MALTAADVRLWRDLLVSGLIPLNPSVLEIGEANWYGDVDPADVAPSLDLSKANGCPFAIAKAFYWSVIGFSSITAIDKHGKHAHDFDLNKPLPWRELRPPFEVIINSGTAEHVFDQRQLFETIHDAGAPGCLMVHACPHTGWREHGFYCYQPTFFRDLAAANGYEILRLRVEIVGQGDDDTMLYVAMRKRKGSGKFVVPMQGRYAG